MNIHQNLENKQWEHFSEKGENKMAFDILLGHKDEIESQLGISLVWERADQYKASWICLSLKDVSVTNEEDWPRMAKFHAEWSDRLCQSAGGFSCGGRL